VIKAPSGTLLDVLEMRVREQPDRPVIRFEDSRLTYQELDNASRAVAAGLQAGGIEPGDAVATLATNGPRSVLTWFALARIGAVEVPINPALAGSLLAEQLEGCVAVVADDGFGPQVEAVAPGLPGLKSVIPMGLTAEPGRAFVPAPVGPDDDSLVLYTSGTTGKSKGVSLTHRANYRLAEAMVGFTGLGGKDVLYTAFPLFHIAARFVSVLAAMLADAEVVVHRRFSASRFWGICRDEGVTAIHYLGSVPMMLYKQPPRPDDADHPVRLAYGAGLPASIFDEFQSRFGLEAFELYGSTEQGVTAMTATDARRPGSCGRAVPWVDLEIHDSGESPVPPGTAGEIVVRPREPGIFFTGYREMPEATLASWRNLWFHTGDLGYLDDDGFLFFMGRLKDAIRRRGENISAWEVERALLAHPGIAEAAAVGVPSELGEEELLVVVVLEPGGPTPEEIGSHCAGLLPAHAVPRYVRIVDTLPKTPSDRVEKYRLQAAGVAPGTWDREKI
jgi:crotonobetaine/carnitine-CoA ligase